MQYNDIIKRLRSLSNPRNIEDKARFGIISKNVLGITKPVMRKIAKDLGKNHNMALRLWDSEIYEARVIAALIDEPALVTEEQMNNWVKDFDNWGICDNTCSNLFDKTPFAYKKAKEWSSRQEEFVKRAGFALVAVLAVHDKKTSDKHFIKFFPMIKRASVDDRNFVKKAVNWALRQIGKRNKRLNKEAIKVAKEIQKIDSRSARWIASDALRELERQKKFL